MYLPANAFHHVTSGRGTARQACARLKDMLLETTVVFCVPFLCCTGSEHFSLGMSLQDIGDLKLGEWTSVSCTVSSNTVVTGLTT